MAANIVAPMDALQQMLINAHELATKSNIEIYPSALTLQNLEAWRKSEGFNLNGYSAIDPNYRTMALPGSFTLVNKPAKLRDNYQSLSTKIRETKDYLIQNHGCSDKQTHQSWLDAVSSVFSPIKSEVIHAIDELMKGLAVTAVESIFDYKQLPQLMQPIKRNYFDACDEFQDHIKLDYLEVSLVYGMFWTAKKVLDEIDPVQHPILHNDVITAYEEGIVRVHYKVVHFCDYKPVSGQRLVEAIEARHNSFITNVKEIIDDLLTELTAVSTLYISISVY